MGYDTYRYYHPDLDRNGSRHLLTKNGVGSFLVRPSSRRGCLSLSVHAPARIAHFLIFISGDDDDEKFQLDPKAWTGHEIKNKFYPALHLLLVALGNQRQMAATFKKGVPRGSEHAENEPPHKLYTDGNLEFLKSEGHVGVSGDEGDYADISDADLDDDHEELGPVVRRSAPPPSQQQFSSESDDSDSPRQSRRGPPPPVAAVVPSLPASSSSSHGGKVAGGKRSMRRNKKKPIGSGGGGAGRAMPSVPSSAPPQKPRAIISAGGRGGGRQSRGMPPSPAEVRANEQATKMTEYKAMLNMCMTDGKITAKQLQTLSSWRQKHNFSNEMHLQALEFLRIKPEEFESMKDFTDQPASTKEICLVCCDKKRNCVLMPCKHMIACYDCGQQLNECPLCRNPIKEIMKFFD